MSGKNNRVVKTQPNLTVWDYEHIKNLIFYFNKMIIIMSRYFEYKSL